jgi:uncharacterized cupredoxin-like copper-binding protein
MQRAATIDQARQRVPVEAVGKRVGEQVRKPEVPELFDTPRAHQAEMVAYSLNAPAGGAKAQTAPSSGNGSGGSGSAAPSTSTKGTAIQVQGGEFFFRLSTKSLAKPGTVTFVFKNIGHVAHDFQINGKQTPLIQPGQTANLVVSFTNNGKYPYLCTVPGHAEAGLKGVFTVG